MDLSTLDIKLARATTLPVLPNVVTQVLMLAEDPGVGLRQYEKVITQDAALTAKILRTANSPYYGGSEVTSLQRALNRLGVNTIRSISMTVAMQSAVSAKSLDKRFPAERFWQHSLAVACGAKILACLTHYPQPEEAFIAGLLHDIGKLAFALYLTAEMEPVYALLQPGKIASATDEIMHLGITHQEVGRIAAQRWGLPASYIAAVSSHHDPNAAQDLKTLVALVHVANAIAHEIKFGFGADEGSESHAADPTMVAFLGLPAAQWEPIRLAVSKEVQRMSTHMHL